MILVVMDPPVTMTESKLQEIRLRFGPSLELFFFFSEWNGAGFGFTALAVCFCLSLMTYQLEATFLCGLVVGNLIF